jgi:hypothetical protein
VLGINPASATVQIQINQKKAARQSAQKTSNQ